MRKGETRESIIKRRKYRKNTVGDSKSLYISIFPAESRYLAKRLGDKKKILAELCCGIGLNMEHIGTSFRRVIGVDSDRNILRACKTNLERSKKNMRFSLIQGDIMKDQIYKKIHADTVIYDIPTWYPKSAFHILQKTLPKVVKKIQARITSDIVLFLPTHYSFLEAKKQLGNIEYQRVYINDVYDRNIIYLGEFIQKPGRTLLKLVN